MKVQIMSLTVLLIGSAWNCSAETRYSFQRTSPEVSPNVTSSEEGVTIKSSSKTECTFACVGMETCVAITYRKEDQDCLLRGDQNLLSDNAQLPGTSSHYKKVVGDGLATPNGSVFSTFDRDLDSSSDSNCAEKYHGAWWYRNCHCSNLNGGYLRGYHASYADGVNWCKWRDLHYSLKVTEMKLRRPK